jgi:hypothetical protein
METLELNHDNGDCRIVQVVNGLFSKGWKKSRKILVIRWGDMAGDYALDIGDNHLYQFGMGSGIRRKALGWHAADLPKAKQIWESVTATGRSINERFERNKR